MPKKIYVGNRIATVLEPEEAEKKKQKNEKASPTNRDIMEVLLLILDAVTEEIPAHRKKVEMDGK